MYMCSSETTLLSYQTVADRVQANLRYGLGSQEAERRRRAHGFNEFDINGEDPLWKKYLDQVKINHSENQLSKV